MFPEPDIIILTEIWIKEEENNFFNLTNYKSFFVNRRTSQAGGVGIFVRNGIQANQIISKDESETSWLGVQLLKSKINIVGVYKSPSANGEYFLEKLEELISSQSTNIIIGDFNIDLLKENQTTTKYNDLIQLYGHQVINKLNKNYATGETSNTKTIIDHIITDCFKYSYQISLDDTTLSDHKQMSINITIDEPSKRKSPTTQYKIIDYKNILRNNEIEKLEEIDNMDSLITKLTELINSNTKTITLNNECNKRKNWITTEIILLIKKRDRLYKLKTKNCGNENILNLFKKTKNKIQHLISSLKENHYSNFFITNKKNPKKIWSGIHELIYNKKQSQQETPQEITENGIKETDPLKIANIFNKFFSNCIKNQPFVNHHPRLVPIHNTNFEYINPSTEVVAEKIKQLNSSSANGYDNISTKFLKHYVVPLSPIITKLMNKELDAGNYPSSLKISKIIPIFKAGDKTEPTNYRPIAVQPAIAKIFEETIKNQLEKILEDNEIINKNQFGFLQKSSTLSACSQLISLIQHKRDENNTVISLFIDLKKAFDSVDHDILLYKLQCLRMSGRTHNILTNFIKNREQFVKIGENLSTTQKITTGVPQGSRLSPTLFNFFIDGIFTVKIHGELQLYADDAVVTCSGKDPLIVAAHVEEDLQNLNAWFNDNKLQINTNKTKYLVFQTNHANSPKIKIHLEGNEIEEVDNIKYLGLHIDNKLNWNNHIKDIKKSITGTAFAIRRVRKIVPEKILWLMYNSYILPKFQYLNPIWNTAAAFRMKELNIIQNRVIKTIKNLPHLYRSHLLYTPVSTLSLSQINEFNTLMYIFKIKNNYIKHNIELKKKKPNT